MHTDAGMLCQAPLALMLETKHCPDWMATVSKLVGRREPYFEVQATTPVTDRRHIKNMINFLA